MAKRIFVVGHCCLDMLACVDRSPLPNEKLEARRMKVTVGGPAANAAVALRRLGHSVRLMAAIGRDLAGAILREELSREQVELVEDTAADGLSSLAQITVRGAERDIVWRRGSFPPLEVSPSRARELLRQTDLLYLDSHEVAAATALARQARQLAVAVVGDLGTLRAGSRELLKFLQVGVAAPRFAAALAGGVGVQPALAALQAVAGEDCLVGITLGEHGSVLRHRELECFVAARRVEVVDSTGAGDAFHAGLADAWLRGRAPVECFEWASVLGAAVCRGLGGSESLPTDRHELERWHRAWPVRGAVDWTRLPLR